MTGVPSILLGLALLRQESFLIGSDTMSGRLSELGTLSPVAAT